MPAEPSFLEICSFLVSSWLQRCWGPCVCVGNVLASPPSVATGETGSSLGCELCPDGGNGMCW